jgi:GR25 family glycosyltransferase involved in LPS biosynthesis
MEWFVEDKKIYIGHDLVMFSSQIIFSLDDIDTTKSINNYIDDNIFPDDLYIKNIKYRDRDITYGDIKSAILYMWVLVHARSMGWNVYFDDTPNYTPNKEIVFSRECLPVYISYQCVCKALAMLSAIKTFFFPIPKMIYCLTQPDILYRFLGWRFLSDELPFSFRKEQFIRRKEESRYKEEKIFHAFGDSHCEILDNISFQSEIGIAHYVGSRLLNTIGTNPHESINILMFDVKDDDDICFCFGEIDCRMYPDKINEKTIDKYFQGIRLICRNLSCRVFIHGMIPTSETSFIEKAKKTDSFVGSDDKRKCISKRLNSYMKTECEKYGFFFLDVYDKYSNNKGFLDEKYSSDAIHVNNPCFIIEEIKKVQDEKIRVMYINLDTRPDRNEHFLKKKGDIKAERFSATNALCKTFSIEQYMKDYIPNLFPVETKIKDCMTKYLYRSAKLGEIGCTLSHLRLYQEGISSISPFIIFEDDVDFSMSELKKFLISNNNHDIDIIFLGWSPNSLFQLYEGKETVIVNDREEKIIMEKLWCDHEHLFDPLIYFKNMQCWNSGGGSFGYLITRNGARKILTFIKTLKHIFWPIDYLILALSTPSFINEMTRTTFPDDMFLKTVLLKKPIVYSKVEIDSDIQRSKSV